MLPLIKISCLEFIINNERRLLVNRVTIEVHKAKFSLLLFAFGSVRFGLVRFKAFNRRRLKQPEPSSCDSTFFTSVSHLPFFFQIFKFSFMKSYRSKRLLNDAGILYFNTWRYYIANFGCFSFKGRGIRQFDQFFY
jgi:hypothetical protein